MCRAINQSTSDKHINDQMFSAFGIEFASRPVGFVGFRQNDSGGRDVRLEVLSHRKQSINGYGYECSITRHSVRFTSTFFNDHIISTLPDEYIRIEAGECWDMVRTNQCRGEKGLLNLVCTGARCRATEQIVEQFKWWSTQERTAYTCTYVERLVSASDANATVFASHCKASDYFCSLDSLAIVVWSRDVVIGCPMHVVMSDVAFTLRDGLFVSTRAKLAVQFESFEEACGMKSLIKTHVGLYLTPVTNVLSDLRARKRLTDQNVLVELLLADEDYNHAIEFQRIVSLRASECENFKRHLQLFALMENQYISEAGTVFYASHGNVYKPRCRAVSEITVQHNSSACYAHIPVSFVFSSSWTGLRITHNAFLSTQGILLDESPIVTCDSSSSSEQVLYHINTSFALIKQANTYTSSMRSPQPNNFSGQDSNWNPKDGDDQFFSHNPLLENGLELLNEFNEINRNVQTQEDGFWSGSSLASSGTVSEQSGLDAFGNSILRLVHSYAVQVVFVVAMAGLICTMLLLVYFRSCYRHPVPVNTSTAIASSPTQRPDCTTSLII